MRYIPVVNSSLLDFSSDEFDAYNMNYSDMALRSGIVLKSYDIDDPENISKNHVEYDVLVVKQDKDLGTSSTVYKKCKVMESFGGISDFVETRLREPEKEPKKNENPQDDTGAIVLLLCLNGNQERGIILGCLGHPKRDTTLTKEKGHHLEGEFNGLNWQINKDGAMTVTFGSAKNAKGEAQDEEAAGSILKIEKDGSIEFTDGNKETVRVDKTEKLIDIIAEGDISATSDANVNITAKENISAKATADLIAEAEGNAMIKSGGQMSIEAGGALDAKAPSAQVQIDGSLMVKANQIQLQGSTVFVGQGGAPALVISTQFIGTGNLGAPVISVPMGPFSSSVFIAQ